MQHSCIISTEEQRNENPCVHEHTADMMAIHLGLKDELCSGLQKLINSHLFSTEDMMRHRIEMLQSYSVPDLFQLAYLNKIKLQEDANFVSLKPKGSPLTDAEYMAIRMLCRAEYNLIQTPLSRNRTPNSLEYALIQLLDNALLKLPKVDNTELTRADTIGDITNYHIGQTINIPYFLTTSRRCMTNVSGIKLLWVIKTKPFGDTCAHDLTLAIEDQFAESQVEFERNTNFCVTKISKIDTKYNGCIPVLYVKEI